MRKWILFLFISHGFSAFSQSVNDAGLWTAVNVEKKLSKRLELFLAEGYRSRENYTQTNLFYTDLGIAVKPLGFIKVSVSYRLIQKAMLNETYSLRHRFNMDILLKKKFGKITTSFRQRLQTQVRNVYDAETDKLPEWAAREKLEIKYDLDKPIKPFAAVELRCQLKDPKHMEFNGTWNRVRYTFGADYKLNSRNSFSLYYLIQRGFNVAKPQNLFITGLAYTLSL